ncbi:dienelactone hydrolase family protein [Terriglobus sp.]|uniref:dienelactone hydrolase family protein n=1 Tax=Terriglobus sp. TaxID=1889013 RepID=UPI003B003CBA
MRRAVLFVLSSCFASAQTAPHFHFTLKPGPYAVGLRVVEQYDYTRTFHSKTDVLGKPYTDERARPIQTLIWYPATPSKANKMTVADYGKLLASETDFSHPGMSFRWQDWIKALTPTLNDSLLAVWDASQVAGQYPVVVYAPSLSAMSWENADLCEYLASFGYVVLASPDMGATTRFMTSDIAGTEAQAKDISFLISYARTLANVDFSNIAVAGFSWGGLSNLFAATRDSRVSALVALDGSMRYFPGIVKQAGYVHPDQMTIPLLYFTQGEISLEHVYLNHSGPDQQGPSVLNQWTHGDLMTVHDLALVHQEHSSMFQRNEDFWKEYAGDHKGDYSREDGVAGYAWICRYTLNFLNAYLKHDAEAAAFLRKTTAENGAPPHLLTADFRPAKGFPASFDSFRTQIGQQGFDQAAAIYATMQKEKPDFKLDKAALLNWSFELQEQNHVPESIVLLKFTCLLYPKSTYDQVALGEAYMKAHQEEAAVAAFNSALSIDPDNEYAKTKLIELKTSEQTAK